MTQEDKQLLLIDLSARLNYGVYIYHKNFPEANLKLSTVFNDGRIGVKQNEIDLTPTSINECKPYLRPMSSMTPDERFEYDELNHFYTKGLTFNVDEIDWLLAHHFDYRGLIPMGLALEAKEGMYKQ